MPNCRQPVFELAFLCDSALLACKIMMWCLKSRLVVVFCLLASHCGVTSSAENVRVSCQTTKGQLDIDVTWAHSPRGVERCVQHRALVLPPLTLVKVPGACQHTLFHEHGHLQSCRGLCCTNWYQWRPGLITMSPVYDH